MSLGTTPRAHARGVTSRVADKVSLGRIYAGEMCRTHLSRNQILRRRCLQKNCNLIYAAASRTKGTRNNNLRAVSAS